MGAQLLFFISNHTSMSSLLGDFFEGQEDVPLLLPSWPAGEHLMLPSLVLDRAVD